MKKNILFLQMFSEYQPPEPLKSGLSQAAISAADLDVAARSVSMELECPRYIPETDLDQVKKDICALYSLRSLTIEPHFPPEELYKIQPEELMQLFVRINSMTRGSLAGANWTWEENALNIQLLANGKQLIEECIPQVRNILSSRFQTPVQICVAAGQSLEGNDLRDALEKMRFTAAGQKATPAVAAEKKQPVLQDGMIFGSLFGGEATPMRDLQGKRTGVIVEGKVFAVEHREVKKRNSWVISFDMTDYTGSVRVKSFLETKKAQPIMDQVKKGMAIKVRGDLNVDKFDGELVLKPYAIMAASMPKREDRAEGMKRVELHLHTTMSSMDALTKTDAAIRQAAAWGHKAIAITDHGCAHSFPDAMHSVEGKGAAKVAGTDTPIKVLYGCEGYLVDDIKSQNIVLGTQDMKLEDTFVAFDLETTGLNPNTDTITEIGAVVFQNGKEVDRFHSFVDPRRKLDPENIALTGITDEMLVGAPYIEDILPKFLDFIGGRVVVAHNAKFDTSFIKMACENCGLPYELTSVDTVALAQQLMPPMPRYKLDVVARALKLPNFNHHRASDDANICGQIMVKLIKMLQDKGFHSIQELNIRLGKKRSKGAILSGKPWHVVIFAKNQMGLRNLYRLISEANLEYFKLSPRIPKSLLMELREGLIIGSACEAGELFNAIVEGQSEEELKRLASFYDYLEIQPISNNRFMLRPDKNGKVRAQSDEDLRNFNRTVVRIADSLGKPVVATGDVHFLNPEDEIFRHILVSMKFSDADTDNPLYFRTTDEMLEEFSYLGEEKAYEVVVTNTNMVADMCENLRPVPHNLFAPSIENSVEDLKNLVYTKFHRLYGDNPPELMVKRVETELNDIISSHYDVIYMSAQKLVQNSLEHGYLVGSRGSVGSSIVAFMSGITEVNSFPPHYRCPNPDCKHTILDVPKGYNCGADLPDTECPLCGTKMEKDGFNIPFETFLGFGGDKVPDIDLNFSGEYQANAHAYCIEMFGKSHVFRAGTIGTVAEKTAYGYVKKYMEKFGKSANSAEMNRLAQGCVDVRRTTGQHPGGLVVIPQENEIWDFCPVQHPADAEDSDQITTHFEYHSMEENLLKLDMLGHDDPTMIRMMEDMTGVDAKTIPLDDPDTMSIFTSSKVLGYENDKLLGQTGAVAIPEFNTRFTRGMLMDTQPTRFDTLVRLSGFSHGTDVWLGNAKDLITSKTATVDSTIGCRDDIMIYLISCGIPEKRAFKIMEAVRKGRGLPDGAEEEMVAAGVPGWYIESCKKIKYLFPKAHAVAYVMMAFRIAWFKVHHPLPFYAAYFYRRSQKDGFDASMMIHGKDIVQANIDAIDNNEEASAKEKDLLTTLEVVYEFYLRGFEFLPVDIYKSDATKFLIQDGKLLPPFVSISGLGESAALSIVEGRNNCQFLSVEEFSAACPKVSKTHIQMLKEAGAFGDLPDVNQVSLF